MQKEDVFMFSACLINFQDGIISVEDIDLVMTEGLGMRYAFIGPIETMHLNAPQGMSRVLHFKHTNSSVGTRSWRLLTPLFTLC